MKLELLYQISFEKYPDVFDTVYINLLRAGESSGKVQLFLQKLVINMEKQQKIKSDIKSALTYPIILLIVAMAVVVLMMIFVVPVFQDMFANNPGGLPGSTQMVVNISDFMRDPLKRRYSSYFIDIHFFYSLIFN